MQFHCSPGLDWHGQQFLSRTVDRLVVRYSEALPSRRRLRGPGLISPSFAREEIAHVRAAVAAMSAGDKPIEEIAAADVRRLLAADRQQPNAARHRFNALRRFFDYLHDEGLSSANPCLAIAKARRPRPPAPRAHCLSLAQCALCGGPPPSCPRSGATSPAS